MARSQPFGGPVQQRPSAEPSFAESLKVLNAAELHKMLNMHRDAGMARMAGIIEAELSGRGEPSAEPVASPAKPVNEPPVQDFTKVGLPKLMHMLDGRSENVEPHRRGHYDRGGDRPPKGGRENR